MRINIKDFSVNKNVIPLCFSLDVQDAKDFPDVVRFLSPVHFEGSAEKTDDFYTVKGKIRTEVCMNCVLCLTPVKVFVECNFFQEYSDIGAGDKDTESFQGDYIDITKALKDTIICEIPIRVLCKDDCKGLCPKCGKDLNLGECACDNTYYNPSFESLRTMFNLDEEV